MNARCVGRYYDGAGGYCAMGMLFKMKGISDSRLLDGTIPPELMDFENRIIAGISADYVWEIQRLNDANKIEELNLLLSQLEIPLICIDNKWVILKYSYA